MIPLQHQLYAATAVLQPDKCDLAHHTLGHHATGQREFFIDIRQGLGIIIGKPLVQVSGVGIGPEIVRIGVGFGLERMQFFTALVDQAVFILCSCRLPCFVLVYSRFIHCVTSLSDLP